MFSILVFGFCFWCVFVVVVVAVKQAWDTILFTGKEKVIYKDKHPPSEISTRGREIK